MKQKYGSIILSPRITEKATFLAGSTNAYAFTIHKDATKPLVVKAIQSLYNVTPVKVAIARTPAKTVFSRGKVGTKSGVKKAYVYLKKGDKIEFV